MITQDEVWLISLVGMGLVTLAFVWVIVQSTKAPASEQRQKTAGKIQRWWFLVLVVAGVGIAYATLRPYPIANQRADSRTAQIVDVVGRQWSWQITPAQVKAGAPVEFNVITADVNHGFAIYAPDDRIVTQTQAMPGYTNRLLYTFTQPGNYRVMCLEYCGLVHHGMVANFEVVAAGKGDSL